MRGRRKWSEIDVSSRWPIAGPKQGFENRTKSEVILASFKRTVRSESISVNESRVEVKCEKQMATETKLIIWKKQNHVSHVEASCV